MSNTQASIPEVLDEIRALLSGPEIEGSGGFAHLARLRRDFFSFIMDGVSMELDNLHAEERNNLNNQLNLLLNNIRERITVTGTVIPESRTNCSTNQSVYFDWRTSGAVFVKNDRIWKSFDTEIGGIALRVDFSETGGKFANEKSFAVPESLHPQGEKRYTLKMTRSFSEKEFPEISALFAGHGIRITQNEWKTINRAIGNPPEADFYILRHPKKNGFDPKGYGIVNKILSAAASFEKTVSALWESKPEIAAMHYAVTFKTLAGSPDGSELIKRMIASPGFNAQASEWKKLLGVTLPPDEISNNNLPLDSRYFPEMEAEIADFLKNNNLIDGVLIHGDNYRAVSLLGEEFAGAVQTIYLDPPFNTGNRFDFIDTYNAGAWLSLMDGRIGHALKLLAEDGNLFLHLDRNTDHYGKLLLEKYFPHIEEIVWNTNSTKDEENGLYGYKSFGNVFIRQHDTIFRASLTDNPKFRKLWKPNRNISQMGLGWLDLISRPLKTNPRAIGDFDFFVEQYDNHGKLVEQKIDIDEKIFPVGDLWNDIYSFMQSELRVSENFGFINQKPENLLRRIIQATTVPGDVLLDPFAGSGSALAAAHKLGRKWIGIEMGEYFTDFRMDGAPGILGRMKIVLHGDHEFTSGDKKRYSHLTRDIGWKGGGAFRYIELQPFEECLKKLTFDGLIRAFRKTVPESGG